MMVKSVIRILLLVIIVYGCDSKESINETVEIKEANVHSLEKIKLFAGGRFSNYGLNPFPSPAESVDMMEKISANFDSSETVSIWIIGTIHDKDCVLEFDNPTNKTYSNIQFYSFDKHEKYLNYFDENNIKVFLQVESANASVKDLIDIIFTKYGKHKSVIGFGVDVEWLREPEYPGYGMKVPDDSAKAWETQLKEYNENYLLFLKHWDREWMPPSYRGEIVFVDDSQQFNSLNSAVDEFTNYWAKYFYPNTVLFQIGYEADKTGVWGKMQNPISEYGNSLLKKIPAEQKKGIIWVDFTMRDVIK